MNTSYVDVSYNGNEEEIQKLLDELSKRPKPTKRPTIVRGTTERFNTPVGKMYVTVNSTPEDGIIETFIEGGESDHINANPYISEIDVLSSLVGRLISLARKYGVPTEAIISQCKKVPGGNSFFHRADGEEHGRMLNNSAAAIALALSRVSENVSEPSTGDVESFGGNDTPRSQESLEKPVVASDGPKNSISSGVPCPSCGSELKVEDGCQNCPSCGWSKCS